VVARDVSRDSGGTTDQAAVDVVELVVDRGGRRVLHGISLQVSIGSVTGLLGPSGCGKTTLLRAIVGVQRISGGELRVLDHPAGAVALRRRVGYVTQAPSVYTDLSVEENLRYFAAIVRAPAARIGEVLATVGLEDARRQLVGSLSGGQRSRVSLASALLSRPDLLVLDEPTTGLDPLLRGQLWRTFRELAATGSTLLISSHQMDEARECDALLLMRDGHILAQTTPDRLRAETGEADLGDAFLAVIRRGET
jgi:ABC-2 type transport system ATP-binding protein